MTRSSSSRLTVSAVLAATALCQFWVLAAQPVASGFSAADCASDGAALNSRLVVFPLGAEEYSIPIPRVLRHVVFGSSGERLFATSFKRIGEKDVTELPGIVRIEFNPVRATDLAGLDDLYVNWFALSLQEDMIWMDGGRYDSTGPTTCGIYKYDVRTEHLQAVLETSDCKAGSPWNIRDLSPSNKEAMILVNLRSLARLDLTSKQISPLEGLRVGSRNAAYSPDGKWIATSEPFPWRTILIDPQDFSRRRTLSTSDGNQVA